MCVAIGFRRIGPVCRTIGELRTVLGGQPVYDEDQEPMPDRLCLCSVNIEATAAKYGFSVDTSDPTVIEFVKP